MLGQSCYWRSHAELQATILASANYWLVKVLVSVISILKHLKMTGMCEEHYQIICLTTYSCPQIWSAPNLDKIESVIKEKFIGQNYFFTFAVVSLIWIQVPDANLGGTTTHSEEHLWDIRTKSEATEKFIRKKKLCVYIFCQIPNTDTVPVMLM